MFRTSSDKTRQTLLVPTIYPDLVAADAHLLSGALSVGVYNRMDSALEKGTAVVILFFYFQKIYQVAYKNGLRARFGVKILSAILYGSILRHVAVGHRCL